jgi:hypothetical protein
VDAGSDHRGNVGKFSLSVQHHRLGIRDYTHWGRWAHRRALLAGGSRKSRCEEGQDGQENQGHFESVEKIDLSVRNVELDS